MGLRFIANTVGKAASEVRLFDNQNAVATDNDGHENVLGGARHLSWTQSNQQTRGIGYGKKAANLILSGMEIDDSSVWTATRVTINANDETDPSGESTLDKLEGTGATGGHHVRQTFALENGKSYRIQALFKADELSQALFQLFKSPTAVEYRFNVGGSQISQTNTTARGYDDLGGSVYRHYMEFTADSTGDWDIYIQLMSGGSSSITVSTGDGLHVGEVECYELNQTLLTADHCVIVDADRHNGHQVTVGTYDNKFPYDSTNLFSNTNFAETLIGPTQKDYVLSFTKQTDVEGFFAAFASGDGGSYTKRFGQIYFGEAVEFNYIYSGSGIQFSRASRDSSQVLHEGKYYQLRGVAGIRFAKVTRAELEAFNALPMDEPLFVYDSEGGDDYGELIDEKLWHCIVLSRESRALGDDLFELDVQLGVLMYWR